MADKNFFDLLKAKVGAFRPADQHREEDWLALGDRLNAALPQPVSPRQRRIILPWLLVAALLSTNAVWWQSSRSDRARLTQLTEQVAALQTAVIAVNNGRRDVRHDTLWQTVYVTSRGLRTNYSAEKESIGRSVQQTNPLLRSPIEASPTVQKNQGQTGVNTGSSAGPSAATLVNRINAASDAVLSPLATLKVPLLEIPKSADRSFSGLVVQFPEEEKPMEPLSKKRAAAIRPKFFKVGGNIGGLFTNSSGLMHEGGFSYNLGGQVGFSRHWSLTAVYGAGRVHYKAHDPAAILGTPQLPVPGYGLHLADLDVTGQRMRQFDLGLRYTLARPGKPRPFLGLSWGSRMLLPFTIHYQTQHEPTGTIHKNIFEVLTKTRQRNILGLHAGLEFPLLSRFDLTLEGYYHRQWKKPGAIAPDLMGIRMGAHWMF